MDYTQFLTHEMLGSLLRVGLVIVIGLPFTFFVSKASGNFLSRRTSAHVGMIIKKTVFFSLLTILVFILLHELNFNLTVFLGTAGILSLAIGFASQASLSNIISGLFLYGERPFKVGDLIQIGETQGLVLSIDLLSIKLRTFDNRFVRIPNETIIKTQVTTVTRYPIRRLDLRIGVAYKESVPHVIQVLEAIAHDNPLCLENPKPLILFEKFGDSSLKFLFGVWCETKHYLELKNSLMQAIKERFHAEGIEIPFPQRTLHFVNAEISEIPKIEAQPPK